MIMNFHEQRTPRWATTLRIWRRFTMSQDGAFILRFAEPCVSESQQGAICGTQTQTRQKGESSDSDFAQAVPRHRPVVSGTETITKVQSEGRDSHAESTLRAIPLHNRSHAPSHRFNNPDQRVNGAIASVCPDDSYLGASSLETVTTVKKEGRDHHLFKSNYAALPNPGRH